MAIGFHLKLISELRCSLEVKSAPNWYQSVPDPRPDLLKLDHSTWKRKLLKRLSSWSRGHWKMLYSKSFQSSRPKILQILNNEIKRQALKKMQCDPKVFGINKEENITKVPFRSS